MEISISAAIDEAMPVAASRSGMSSLLRQLQSLTDTISSLPGGEGVSEDEIQDFKISLGGLCANLKDLAEVERTSSFTAKRWVQEVRELCYDTEDYMDRVMHSGGSLVKHKKRRRQIAADFSGLKARAKGAGERYIRCVIPAQTIKSNCQEASSSQQHPLPAQLSSVLGVHGHIADRIDGLMDHLVNLLAFNSQEQFKVVPILGFAGVGKTTLARSLYHKYGARFECRAFLRLSRNPDHRRSAISMLSQIKAPQTPVSSDVQDLFDNVKKHLQGKRYLIVIDDLRASTTWDIISRAFPRGNCYSRIITTTQTEDVAKACCIYNSMDIFKMRPLNNIQFSGLPFETTIMVAALLKCNPTIVAHWGHLQNSVHNNSASEGMNELLSLIYDSLPHHLKTCLLHFNMYPEDYTIKKGDLVKQWVAEEFLDEVNGQDMEMVAKRYFDELIDRGLIQPVDVNYNNEVLSCTVHHIVLDFIRYKCKEENFITTVDYFQARPGNPDKVRRLSVQFGGAKGAKLPGSIRMSQIRSLVYFGFFKCVPSIVEFGLLRVLILQVWADKDKISFDLSSIPELFRLRYLKVACNVSVKLPSKIGRLQYLETLDLDARVVGFPADIVHLQLLHLRLPRETSMPHGIDKMTSLCSLAHFQISDSSRDNVLNLGRLTNLQDLHLTCSGIQTDRAVVNLESFWSIMEKFSKLKSLVLDDSASTTSIPCDGLSILSTPPPDLQKVELSPETFIFPSLPEWIGRFSRLCNLKIAVRDFPRNNIDILKRLTTLTVLSLSVRTTPTDRIVFDEGFQAIRYFKFTCAAPCLSFVEGAMVNVVRLKLVFNGSSIEQYDLTSVCFQYLTSLKDISVKFGDTSSCSPSGRNAAECALDSAVSKHPSTPIVNVKWAEGIFAGDEVKSISAQKRELQAPEGLVIITGKDSYELEVQEKEYRGTEEQKGKHQTSEKQDVIKGKGTEEQGLQETISREDIGKQDNSRSFKLSESSFRTQNTDEDENARTPEEEHWTPEKQDVTIAVKGSDEKHLTDLEEEQADTRTSMSAESPSHLHDQATGHLVEADVSRLMSNIMQAAATVRQNKEECEQLARSVFQITQLLPQLQDHYQSEAMRWLEPLARLFDNTLREAHKLVMACQKKSVVYRLVTAGRQSQRFRYVQNRIDHYLFLLSHRYITPRLDRINRVPPAPSDTSVPRTPASPELQVQDAAMITWMEPHHAHVVQEFTFKELVAASNNFAPYRLIGSGSFGKVYLGILPNGRQVAIKRRQLGSRMVLKEFHAQVALLSVLHHKNIIRLVGWCMVKDKRRLRKNMMEGEHLLIFDYMMNGSLSDCLHGPSSWSSSYCSPAAMSLEMRIEILLGVSHAIDYLHSYAVPPVIHLGINPSNILLDSSWVPRLSGFGLAVTETESDFRLAGTMGYIDPELISTSIPNPKNDVYGFGVVMLEVLTGRKPLFLRDEMRVYIEEEHGDESEEETYHSEFRMDLGSTVRQLIKAGGQRRLLDKRLAAEPTTRQLEAVDLLAHTAARCLEFECKDRPAMSDVVANLQSALKLVRSDEWTDDIRPF